MKSTDAFDQEFLDNMKAILLEEKERLERELGQFTKKDEKVADEYNATIPEYGNEEEDNAREVADYTVNKTLEITLEKSLRDVNAALRRMEEGTYGICKYTGEPINKKRLQARPTSSSSVNAKKMLTDEA